MLLFFSYLFLFICIVFYFIFIIFINVFSCNIKYCHNLLRPCIHITIILGIYANNPKGRHSQLAQKLLVDYGPTFCRPVYDFNQTIVVQLYLYLGQILQLVSYEKSFLFVNVWCISLINSCQATNVSRRKI